MKSKLNKTIDLTIEEGKVYLDRCIKVNSRFDVGGILDKTLLGDTFEILSLMPEKFIDLLIVDPPYNIDKDFHGNKFKKSADGIYEEYTKAWIERVLPLLKNTASVYVCCDWKSSIVIANVLKRYFIIQNRITWQREKGRGALYNWKNGMEDIWFAVKNPKDYYFNIDAVKVKRRVRAPYRIEGQPKDWEQSEDGKYRFTCPSNFWDDISVPFWSMPENTEHPTQKPEKLYAKLLLASSKSGDRVFDPFLGSGTLAVVARKLNRKFCGVEINEEIKTLQG